MNNKLYVGNLSYTIDSAKLKEFFAQIGEVVESVVISDKFSGKSKGFGFVTMADETLANKAIDELNDKELDGRKVKVSIARPMK